MPKKVEQVNLDLSMEKAVDTKVSQTELLKIISDELRGHCEIEVKNTENSHRKFIDAKINNSKYAFLVGNVTYLGHPHPLYKKRIQLDRKVIQLYRELSREYIVKIIGIYIFKENITFVDFINQDMETTRAKTKSMHVYTNDIYQAVVHGMFTRIDRFGNEINTISKGNLMNYLNVGVKQQDEILDLIQEFNNNFPFNKRINGIEAYRRMIEANYRSKFQSEWPGFSLEYDYELFLDNPSTSDVLEVTKTSEVEHKLDFDLYSPKNKFYLDLKSSDISKTQLPLNDQQNVNEALKKDGKLWYIVYEHESIRDEIANMGVTEYWNAQINLIEKKNKKPTSYKTRMKAEVTFKRMFVLEVNEVNKNLLLEDFKQGKNSNGDERKPKYKVSKKHIENFIVYRYERN